MKKVIGLIILFFCLSLSLPVNADIGLGGGYAKGTHSRGGDTSFDGGAVTRFSFQDEIYNRWLYAGIQFDRVWINMTSDQDSGHTKKSTLDVYTGIAYVRQYFQITEKLRFSAQEGLGWMYVDGPEYEEADGLCFELGGGFGYALYQTKDELPDIVELELSTTWVRGIGNRVSDTQYIAPMVGLVYWF